MDQTATALWQQRHDDERGRHCRNGCHLIKINAQRAITYYKTQTLVVAIVLFWRTRPAHAPLERERESSYEVTCCRRRRAARHCEHSQCRRNCDRLMAMILVAQICMQPHRRSLPITAHHVDGSFAAAFRRNLVGLRAATRTRGLHGLLVGPDSRRIMIAAVPRRIAQRHRR